MSLSLEIPWNQWRPRLLLGRLGRILDQPRAGFRTTHLAAALFENLNLHVLLLSAVLLSIAVSDPRRLSQVVDDDVDEPGAERAFVLLLVVFHDLLLVLTNELVCSR